MTDENIEDEASINAQADTRRHQIAARRYREECRGVVIAGRRYDSDRKSQGRVTGAVVAAQQALSANAPFSLRWKTRDGWVALDAQQMVAMANAVLAHVQACFDRESELLDAVETGTYSDEMLGTGWPQSQHGP